MPSDKLVRTGALRAIKVLVVFAVLEIGSISVMHLIDGDYSRLDVAYWVRTLVAACGYSLAIGVLAFVYYVWIEKRAE
jgi:hypothetical protein